MTAADQGLTFVLVDRSLDEDQRICALAVALYTLADRRTCASTVCTFIAGQKTVALTVYLTAPWEGEWLAVHFGCLSAECFYTVKGLPGKSTTESK